jgi:UDPglucose 6-dehydrogenase
MDEARKEMKIEFCKDAYDAAKGADAVVLVTEWSEFRELDFDKVKKLLKKPFVFDGRNIYDPKALRAKGFTYTGLGRQ